MTTVRSKDGTRIAFDRSGSGPPIILVGGAFNDRSSSARLAAQLAPHFTVYSYDRRGRGASGDTPPYTVDREIEDLAALIDEAGGAASVYGISSGGVLALEAAARGLPITQLAVYEPPLMLEGSRPRPPKNLAARIEVLTSAGRRSEAVAIYLNELVELPADRVAGMRHAPIWPALEAIAHTLVYDLAVLGDFSVPFERLASISVPTTVIDGGASPPWMRETGNAIADAIPAGRHRTLEGQTHDVAPDVLAAALVELLAR